MTSAGGIYSSRDIINSMALNVQSLLRYTVLAHSSKVRLMKECAVEMFIESGIRGGT